jgi:hypothetical protein
MEKNKVVEQMLKFRTADYDVRVWRDCTTTYHESFDIDEVILKYGAVGKFELGEQISKLPAVAAVEVLDRSGNGFVVYPDWK